MSATRHLLTLLIAVTICVTAQIRAQGNDFAHAASDSILPFLVVGEAAIYSSDKKDAVQGAKALAATGLATGLLKLTIHARRPEGTGLGSFPSGHTSAAFAMATVLSDHKPKLTIPAYVVASTIGWSRVEIDAHRWDEVLAGAALGYFTAKRFTGNRVSISPRGLTYRCDL